VIQFEVKYLVKISLGGRAIGEPWGWIFKVEKVNINKVEVKPALRAVYCSPKTLNKKTASSKSILKI
jgi:hypothetical protein